MRCWTLIRHIRFHDKHTNYHGSNRIRIHNRETIHIGIQWSFVYKGHRSYVNESQPVTTLQYGSARQPVPCHRSNEHHQSKRWIHGMLTVSGDKCISQYMVTNKYAAQLLATYCAYVASRVESTQDWVSCNKILCAGGDRVTQCVTNKCDIQYFGGADASIWVGPHIWYLTI